MLHMLHLLSVSEFAGLTDCIACTEIFLVVMVQLQLILLSVFSFNLFSQLALFPPLLYIFGGFFFLLLAS